MTYLRRALHLSLFPFMTYFCYWSKSILIQRHIASLKLLYLNRKFKQENKIIFYTVIFKLQEQTSIWRNLIGIYRTVFLRHHLQKVWKTTRKKFAKKTFIIWLDCNIYCWQLIRNSNLQNKESFSKLMIKFNRIT